MASQTEKTREENVSATEQHGEAPRTDEGEEAEAPGKRKRSTRRKGKKMTT